MARRHTHTGGLLGIPPGGLGTVDENLGVIREDDESSIANLEVPVLVADMRRDLYRYMKADTPENVAQFGNIMHDVS